VAVLDQRGAADVHCQVEHDVARAHQGPESAAIVASIAALRQKRHALGAGKRGGGVVGLERRRPVGLCGVLQRLAGREQPARPVRNGHPAAQTGFVQTQTGEV
jgi:hypothetical protein